MDDRGNILRAIRLFTADSKYNLNIGLFAQRLDLSVFDNTSKGAPIIKFLFSHQTALQLRMIIEKILADKEAQPIEIGYRPYNKDTKLNEYRSSIAVGRDTNKVMYFDVAGDRHKDPIRFKLIIDRGVSINGMELNETTGSEMGARTIVEALNILIKASYFAKDKPFTPEEGNGDFPKPPPIGDDVGF